MRAVILAAGKGIRLFPYTASMPKCLLEINRVPILERTVRQLHAQGVKEIAVMIGYLAEKVEAKMDELQSRLTDITLHSIVNPLYYRTGTIYSLWLTREWAKEGFILVEGDVVFEQAILEDLVRTPHPNVLVVDFRSPVGEEEMKVLIDGENLISISKDLDPAKSQGEYIGLAKFSLEGSRMFLAEVERMVEGGQVGVFYEAALQNILQRIPLFLQATGKRRWTEIDYIDEYQRAREIFLDELTARPLALDPSLFKGTTHSPSVGLLAGGIEAAHLLEFCHPTNPYFPPEEMVNELLFQFPRVMRQYPSENRRLSLLLAERLGVDVEEVVVGNGASELISMVNYTLVERPLVPIPTFSEFMEAPRAAEKQVIPLQLQEDREFALDVDEVVAAVRQSGADALVLINPHNPTGHLIEPHDLKALLAELQDLRMIMLDESFIEFASVSQVPTLIHDRADYPNLVFVRSLGKDYGIPGLRLGCLVAANRSVVSRIRRLLPAWNVNGLAELFLELLPKYEDVYEEARIQSIEATQELYQAVSSLQGLKAYPTRANFVLAKVTNGMTSTTLRDVLLSRYLIYIRDCANKEGLGERFVRIASRTTEENAQFVRILQTVLESEVDELCASDRLCGGVGI